MTKTEAPTTRAAVYVRISDDKTGAGLGVDRQERECRALAKRLGWTAQRVYCDNDISAYSGKRRPDYEAMLTDIAAGSVDAVIAWHPDRLHRAPKELERYIDVCEARRVPTHTVQAGVWDLSTATGRMIARQIGVQARYESELKSERVKAAWVQSSQNGEWHGGRRPYGFEADGTNVRPDEAAEIVGMAEAIVSGQSLNSVVRDLNRRKVPTASGGESRWQGKTIREMLMRPRLAGFSEHRGEIVGKGKWPAILDETTWRAVVSILSSRTKGKQERGRGPRWLGSGIYICGVCGNRRLKVTNASRGRKIYRCAHREVEDVQRTHVTREALGLDAYVEGLLIDYLSKPGRIDKLLARDDTDDTTRLRVELADIEAQKDAMAEAFGNGDIDLGQLTAATKAFNERVQRLTDQIAAAGIRSPLEPLAHGDIRELWADLTLDQRREILRTVVDITIKPTGYRRRGDALDSDAIGVRWLLGNKGRSAA